MGIKTSKHHLLAAAAFVFAITAAGCVSEDNATTEPGRDAAFLGYSNPDTKQTTCGNCHVDVQAEWRQTKHANAWADLQASGSAQPMCSRCHTVNGLTNGVGDSTGFFAVSTDARPFYQDVQCEACHGPGAQHVQAPGESQPIPTMLVPADYSDGCTACHNGTHQPFAEQLAASRHGRMPNWETRGCQTPCHSGFGAIAVYNPRFRYRGQVVGDTTALKAAGRQGLTCNVCHQPHEATDAQLRMEGVTAEADTSQHVCGMCHNRGAVASAAAGSWRSSRGAHSAQFASLQGYAGWLPGSLVNLKGPARHGTMEGSCARCHMHNAALNDAAGTFAVQNVGHTFEVIPCLNAASLNTGGVDTTSACTEVRRDFSACATSDCHGSEESARHAFEITQADVKWYVRTLWNDLNGNGSVDAFPTDSGWLPLIAQHDSRFVAGTKRLATSGADTVFTVAKGARFNVLTFGHTAGHADGSWGVHNPGYIRTLMAKMVDTVRTIYGAIDTLPPAPARVQALLARDLGARRR